MSQDVHVFVCAQWILKDSLLQTIKLRSGPRRLALLNKHAPDPPTHRHRNDSK